jgi:hypothetical protein
MDLGRDGSPPASLANVDLAISSDPIVLRIVEAEHERVPRPVTVEIELEAIRAPRAPSPRFTGARAVAASSGASPSRL